MKTFTAKKRIMLSVMSIAAILFGVFGSQALAQSGQMDEPVVQEELVRQQVSAADGDKLMASSNRIWSSSPSVSRPVRSFSLRPGNPSKSSTRLGADCVMSKPPSYFVLSADCMSATHNAACILLPGGVPRADARFTGSLIFGVAETRRPNHRPTRLAYETLLAHDETPR